MPIVFNFSRRITINFHDYQPIELYRLLRRLLKNTNPCSTFRLAAVLVALSLAAAIVKSVTTSEFVVELALSCAQSQCSAARLRTDSGL